MVFGIEQENDYIHSFKMKMIKKHLSSQGVSKNGKNHTKGIAVFVHGDGPYLFNAHTMIGILRGSNSVVIR